jgi:p-aminobenzoyl-glutamate transporter AbgT
MAVSTPPFFIKYEPTGTGIALMRPYSIVFGPLWTALLIARIKFGLPFGSGAELFWKP